MEKFKSFIKGKKGIIIIAVISILMVFGCIGGVFVYNENIKKEKILNAMKVTFKEKIKTDEFEYGSEVEVKDLIKVEHGEVKDYPKIDITKIGEQTLKFVVGKGKYSKKFEQKIKVIDTKAPEITFEVDAKELIVGDEFDIKSNITGVKDPVDGDIRLVEDAKSINEKATEEYKKLTKVDIKDDTKIADKTISDFAIVDGEKEENGKKLFLKNCFYVDGSIDTATAGDYTIKIVAVDKNGTVSEKEYTVSVKEKPIEPIQQTGGGSTGGSYSNASDGNSGGSASGGGGSVATAPKGKDWMISYANGFIGQTGWNCQDFVDECLRAAGYLSPSLPNFAYGGTDIGWQDLCPGDVVGVRYLNGQGHAFIITSYPTIDEYGNYRWSTIDGGIGSSQRVEPSTLGYNPSNGGLQFLYLKRY